MGERTGRSKRERSLGEKREVTEKGLLGKKEPRKQLDTA